MLLDAARTPLPCWCWFRGLWHDKLAWHILLLCEMASEFDVGRDCRRQEPSGDACAVGCSTNYGWVPHSLFCLGLTLTAWHVILRAWMPWNWRLKHGRSRGSWQVEFFDIPFASICLKMTDIVNVFDMCLIFFEFLCFSVFFCLFHMHSDRYTYNCIHSWPRPCFDFQCCLSWRIRSKDHFQQRQTTSQIQAKGFASQLCLITTHSQSYYPWSILTQPSHEVLMLCLKVEHPIYHHLSHEKWLWLASPEHVQPDSPRKTRRSRAAWGSWGVRAGWDDFGAVKRSGWWFYPLAI